MEKELDPIIGKPSINSRIEYIITALYKGNQTAFARKMGVTNSAINNIVGGRMSAPSYQLLERIASIDCISPDWLLRGVGDPFVSDESMSRVNVLPTCSLKTPPRKEEDQAIPFYNIAARAGILSQILDTHQNPDDHIYIPNMPRCDGAIGVLGDSMHPTIKSGNIIAFNFIADISDIRWGHIYIIDFHHYGEDILCVKRVYRSDIGEEHIKLVSDNQNYPPEDIPCSSVRKIASVRLYLAKYPNI